MQELLLGGMEAVSQAEVASALQVFFNLGDLPGVRRSRPLPPTPSLRTPSDLPCRHALDLSNNCPYASVEWLRMNTSNSVNEPVLTCK